MAATLKELVFRQHRETRNKLILCQTIGNMALSGIELTEKDEARILYLCEHPDEYDVILEELIRKHTVNEWRMPGVNGSNGEINEEDLVRYDD